MKIKEGLVYHLKDEYFELTGDYGVKRKPDNGKSFPAYCCRKDDTSGLLWMIPMSTKIEKYEAVAEKELRKFGRCFSIVFGTFDARAVVFQVQETFPVLKKHILKPHTRKGGIVRVDPALQEIIRYNFDKLMELYYEGINCVLTDIDGVKQLICSKEEAEYAE